jgi:hypothetical protein
MKILILHRIPFSKVRYDRWIDHECNSVTYACREQESLALLKAELPEQIHAITILRTEQSDKDYDRVVALSEYDLIEAAKLREDFSIPGPTLSATQLVRDKAAMKERIREAYIPSPRFISADQIDQLPELPDWTSRRLILKPKSGASSEGVREIRSTQELQEAISSLENPKEFELEEFIDAQVVHFDGFVREGKLQLFQPSRYVGDCLNYTRGAPLGSFQVDQVSTDDAGWIQKVLVALSIHEGTFHIEAFDLEGNLVFLEAANRCGGADVVPLFERKWGVNLYAELIHSQLLAPLKIDSQVSRPVDDKFAWFLVPFNEGVTQEWINSAEQAAREASLTVLEWRRTDRPFALKKNTVSYQAKDIPLSVTFRAETHGPLHGLMASWLNQLAPQNQRIDRG